MNVLVVFDTRGRGTAWTHEIHLPKKNIRLGVICHEFGHCRCMQRYGIPTGAKHDKKHWKMSRAIFGYAKQFKVTRIDEVIRGNDIY